jgi:hypothetical protein
VPAGLKAKAPAVLYLHPTTVIGKGEARHIMSASWTAAADSATAY